MMIYEINKNSTKLKRGCKFDYLIRFEVRHKFLSPYDRSAVLEKFSERFQCGENFKDILLSKQQAIKTQTFALRLPSLVALLNYESVASNCSIL